ncbi:MAG: PilZ domain-containing protein [Bdellovibrionia bacterium]
MSENTEKPSDLVSVTNYLEIIKYFDEGAKARAGMSVWTNSNEDIATCNIVSLSQTEKMIYTTPLGTADPKKFEEKLKAAGDRCFLNVKLERATLFFTSKLHASSFTNMQFVLPAKIFKVQRRQKQRFTILPGYVLRVSFRDPLDLKIEHKEKVYDVSSVGLSFLVNNEDASVFQPGQVLKNLTFTLRGHEFNCAAEIVQCKPFVNNAENVNGQNQNKIKVGIKFLEIDDAAIIDGYVFEETRKFYTRFM